ncbi:class I SAM-dependent methyltransferase [Occultella glacieicola]|uniref:Class I SAM-dependent methyltransferase n=1 Tax=Occultella glacieicola TaxID=2518684 RepID=A0ABY2E7A2_9MICO|nr:class I SAM-dependent methyltransferase [Occultella glacieicola]TDE97429.1 class I SAM-dependent methyltransferase [Occultella glacieicola]
MERDAATTDWTTYYTRGQGRPARDLVIHGAAAAPAPGHAVDLGCGDGAETAWLLANGWRVTAVDRTPEAMPLVHANAATALGEDPGARLTTVVADLAQARVPEADLVLASASLPFVPEHEFESMWLRIRAAVADGGVLAVNLFGVNDSWAHPETGIANMTFHDRAAVEALFEGLEIVELTEVEHDGPSGAGPKHWHRFDVIARG